MYHAVLETPEGKIETVNGVIKWEVMGPFLFLNGTDFEILISSQHYKFIDIQDGCQ